MSAPFEEHSGVVPCVTPWGQWYQTLQEVFIEVQVPPGTRVQEGHPVRPAEPACGSGRGWP
ncbi:NudC domain-containing protein 2 [Lemmus lemmus]